MAKKYIDAERLKAEIERLYDGEAPKHAQQCDFDDGYFTGIGAVLKFLDSLSEEPDNEDLNDEIKKFIEEYGYERGEDKLLIAIVARHFASWQKQQMLKDAVEGEIRVRYSGCLCATTIRAINEDKFKLGDKVRVIIVKED